MKLTIDTSDWTRIREVYNLADREGVSVQDMIRRLVNSGLSHQVSDFPGEQPVSTQLPAIYSDPRLERIRQRDVEAHRAWKLAHQDCI